MRRTVRDQAGRQVFGRDKREQAIVAKMTPIEAAFWGAAKDDSGNRVHLIENPERPSQFYVADDYLPRPKYRDVLIGYQCKFGPYRIDFVIKRMGVVSRARTIFIECDGHEFHERTKEQAARDRARDRFMQQLAPVLRFTGSELWREPGRCWREAIEFWDERVASEAASSRVDRCLTLFEAITQDETVDEVSSSLVADFLLFGDHERDLVTAWRRDRSWLRQKGVTEDNFSKITADLTPYFSCAVDTQGCFIFRLRQNWAGAIDAP